MWPLFVTLLKKNSHKHLLFCTQWRVKEGTLSPFLELDPRCLWWAYWRDHSCVTGRDVMLWLTKPGHTFFQLFYNVWVGPNFRAQVILRWHFALTGRAHWIEHRPVNWKVLVQFLIRAFDWIVGQVHSWEHVQEATDGCVSRTLMFLSLSFSLPFPSL